MNTSAAIPLHVYTVQLETLSPVAIGAGKEAVLSPYTDFVLNNQKVHIIDHKALSKELEQRPELIEEFVRGVRNTIDNNRSEFDLKDFIIQDLNCPLNKVTASVREVISYKGTVEIQRCVTTNGKPYIPGSSIKGAIRTAVLLDWLLHNKRGQTAKAKMIRLANQGYKDSLSQFKEQVNCFGPIAKDQFRYLHISDSNAAEVDSLAIIKRDRFSLDTRNKDIPIVGEAIRRDTAFTFSLRILGQQTAGISVEKYNVLHDNYFKFLQDGDAIKLFKYIKNYARLNAMREYRILSKCGKEYAQPIDFYRTLLNKINYLKDNETILRLGAGKTYFDNSIGLMFDAKTEDKQLRRFLKTALETRKKKISINHSDEYPQTRSFSILDKEIDLPYGWVKLTINKKGIHK